MTRRGPGPGLRHVFADFIPRHVGCVRRKRRASFRGGLHLQVMSSMDRFSKSREWLESAETVNQVAARAAGIALDGPAMQPSDASVYHDSCAWIWRFRHKCGLWRNTVVCGFLALGPGPWQRTGIGAAAGFQPPSTAWPGADLQQHSAWGIIPPQPRDPMRRSHGRAVGAFGTGFRLCRRCGSSAIMTKRRVAAR